MKPPWTLLLAGFWIDNVGVVRTIVSQIKFLSNNWPHVSLSACLIKFRNSRHAAVVCNSDACLAVILGFLDKVGNPCKPIQNTVFAVDVKVGEFRHFQTCTS